MGSKSKSKTSSTSYTTTETVNAALNDEAQFTKDGASARDLATAVSLKGDANTITITDNGAVAQALQAADAASARAAASQGQVLNTTRDILSDQVDAVKQLAENLKLDDEQTAKMIALAVIVGLVLVAVVYFWKG